MPLEVVFYEGKRELLSAKVGGVSGVASDDPVFTPAADAKAINAERAQLAQDVTKGMLIKKQFPVYPQDAKDARVSGTVVLQATIGVDGAIHDLHVVQAPWPSLVASALIAVSKWQYKPYLLNGEPVEVETTINVIYSFGP
jgi:protein TonB